MTTDTGCNLKIINKTATVDCNHSFIIYQLCKLHSMRYAALQFQVCQQPSEKQSEQRPERIAVNLHTCTASQSTNKQTNNNQIPLLDQSTLNPHLESKHANEVHLSVLFPPSACIILQKDWTFTRKIKKVLLTRVEWEGGELRLDCQWKGPGGQQRTRKRSYVRRITNCKEIRSSVFRLLGRGALLCLTLVSESFSDAAHAF